MSDAQKLAEWADQMRHISAQGLIFSQTIYDKDNYKIIQDIAVGMLAMATGLSDEEIEPMRLTHFVRPTPFATCDAAIIDEEGRMLLIRRADNGKWAMPGGGSDVGEPPAQGAIREALEETGVHAEPIALVGVHDSRLHNSRSPFQLYQMTFLCRPLPIPREVPSSHANEVLETAWFSETELPPDLDPNHITRIPEAFRVWRGDKAAFFDRE